MSERFSWRVWNGSGSHVTELALMRDDIPRGYVWRIAGDRWAFGVERRSALMETSTRHEAQRRLLKHAHWMLELIKLALPPPSQP